MTRQVSVSAVDSPDRSLARSESSAPEGEAPGSPTVKLGFHWPHAMSMSVRVTHQRQRDREQARSAITYKMGVSENERGLRISYASYLPYLQVPGAAPTEQHGMRERMAQLIPSVITDAEGGFRAVGDLARSSRAKRLAALGVKGNGPRQRAARAVDDDGLTRAARRFWDDRVGRWRGHPELEQGEPQEEPDVLQVPELEDAEVLAVTRYQLVGWVKCDEEDARGRCVEIHLETTPDTEALREAVTAFRRARGRYAGAVVRELEVKRRAELVTEPGTLRPHRYKEDRFTMVGLRDPRGHETHSMTTDSQLEVYTYSMPAKR